MEYGLVLYGTQDVNAKLKFVFKYDYVLKEYFSDRLYGESVHGIYIGIVCMSHEYAQFFRQRITYTRKKIFEYRVFLEYESVLTATEKEIQTMLCNSLLNTIDSAVASRPRIKDFDIESYKRDLKSFFLEQGWLEE